MSFKAELFLEGKKFNILHCEYSLKQHIDHNGKPAARPRGGQIAVLIESMADTELFDWMVSHTQTKSGHITFLRRDTLAKMKELQFSDAYCIEYKESFSASGEHPMQVYFVLSAREMKLGSSIYENSWPAN